MEERGGNDIIFCGKKTDMRPFNQPLWPFMRQAMLSHGSRIALVNPYTKQQWTYREVITLAERLARGLVKLGLKQGGTLCMFAPNSVHSVFLYLATLAAGAVIHGTNPASVPVELKRQLVLTDAEFIVTVPELLASVQEAVAGTSVRVVLMGPRDGHLNYDDLLTLGTEDVTLPTSFGDPATTVSMLLFSSGTTGLPKGVESTHRSVMAWIQTLPIIDGMLQENETAVLFLPFFHVYGITVTLFSMLCYGARLVIMEKFDITNYLTFLERYQATTLFVVPPVVIGLLNHPKTSDYNLSHIRTVLSGAAPLGKETETLFHQRFGVPCLQGYGMTEYPVATLETSLKNNLGSCGMPTPNAEFKVIDSETGKCLGVNQTGDLYKCGPLLMKGYHKNPEATADTIDAQGWLKTGDVGRFDSNGLLYIVDRKKELIKYKGEQVPPAMLEDVLLSHPGISDAAVIGRPDDTAGELPMAFVVKATGHDDLTEKEVKDFVAKNVASYMQLRGGVQFRKQIPKSPSGKILRRLLRDELKLQLNSKL